MTHRSAVLFGRVSRAALTALSAAALVGVGLPAVAQTSTPPAAFTIEQVTSYPYPSELTVGAHRLAPRLGVRRARRAERLRRRRSGFPAAQAHGVHERRRTGVDESLNLRRRQVGGVRARRRSRRELGRRGRARARSDLEPSAAARRDLCRSASRGGAAEAARPGRRTRSLAEERSRSRTRATVRSSSSRSTAARRASGSSSRAARAIRPSGRPTAVVSRSSRIAADHSFIGIFTSDAEPIRLARAVDESRPHAPLVARWHAHRVR